MLHHAKGGARASTAPSSLLPRCLIPEEDLSGHIEYKLRLPSSPTPERLARLTSQLKWRLLEGGGEAIYEIGVCDNGYLLGIDEKELESSFSTLEVMADGLGARVEILRRVQLPDDTRHAGSRRTENDDSSRRSSSNTVPFPVGSRSRSRSSTPPTSSLATPSSSVSLRSNTPATVGCPGLPFNTTGLKSKGTSPKLTKAQRKALYRYGGEIEAPVPLHPPTRHSPLSWRAAAHATVDVPVGGAEEEDLGFLNFGSDDDAPATLDELQDSSSDVQPEYDVVDAGGSLSLSLYQSRPKEAGHNRWPDMDEKALPLALASGTSVADPAASMGDRSNHRSTVTTPSQGSTMAVSITKSNTAGEDACWSLGSAADVPSLSTSAATSEQASSLDPAEEERLRLRRESRKRWKRERKLAERTARDAALAQSRAVEAEHLLRARMLQSPGDKFMDGLAHLFDESMHLASTSSFTQDQDEDGLHMDGNEQAADSMTSGVGDAVRANITKKNKKKPKKMRPPIAPVTPTFRQDQDDTGGKASPVHDDEDLTGASQPHVGRTWLRIPPLGVVSPGGGKERYVMECLVYYPSSVSDDDDGEEGDSLQTNGGGGVGGAPLGVAGTRRRVSAAKRSFIDFERSFDELQGRSV